MAAHCSSLAWEMPWTEEPGEYSPWRCRESDTTKASEDSALRFSNTEFSRSSQLPSCKNETLYPLNNAPWPHVTPIPHCLYESICCRYSQVESVFPSDSCVSFRIMSSMLDISNFKSVLLICVRLCDPVDRS